VAGFPGWGEGARYSYCTSGRLKRPGGQGGLYLARLACLMRAAADGDWAGASERGSGASAGAGDDFWALAGRDAFRSGPRGLQCFCWRAASGRQRRADEI
jgi:hypothetical protein